MITPMPTARAATPSRGIREWSSPRGLSRGRDDAEIVISVKGSVDGPHEKRNSRKTREYGADARCVGRRKLEGTREFATPRRLGRVPRLVIGSSKRQLTEIRHGAVGGRLRSRNFAPED